MKISAKIAHEAEEWKKIKAKDGNNLYIDGILHGLKMAMRLAEWTEYSDEEIRTMIQAELAEQI